MAQISPKRMRSTAGELWAARKELIRKDMALRTMESIHGMAVRVLRWSMAEKNILGWSTLKHLVVVKDFLGPDVSYTKILVGACK